MGVGALVLLGWALQVPALKSLLPGFASMKANTALGFVLGGAALGATQLPQARRGAAQLCVSCALVLAALGAATAVQDLLGWNSGIDEALATDRESAVHGGKPGRMSPVTAMSFVLLGLALALLPFQGERRARWSQSLALAALSLALVALMGYAYDVHALYRVGPYSSVALHTALAFCVLAGGILAATADRGWMRQVSSASAGGVMLRQVLLPAVGLLMILGGLRLRGEQAGLYDTAFGLALMVMAAVLVLVVLVWRGARRLDAAEARLRAVADAVPSLIWISDASGRVGFVNARWEELTGTPAARAMGAGWRDFVHPEDAARSAAAFEQAWKERTDCVVEHRFLGSGGRYRWMVVAGRPRFGQAGEFEGHVGSSTDITPLVEARQALAEREQLLGLALKASGIGFWVWDFAETKVYFSAEWKSQLGYADDELPNRIEEWASRLHPDDRKTGPDVLSSYLSTPPESFRHQFRLLHRDGSYRWIETHGRLLRDASGGPLRMLGCHVDFTEHKHAELAVRSLSRRLMEAEENERRTLSRELHDRVGQGLSALNLNLQLVRDQLPEQARPALDERIAEAQRLLQATTRQVRDVMAELRPPGLDDYGLFTALFNYAESLRGRFPARIELDGADPEPRLPIESETALFRIAQEALINVAKHARARSVDIRVEDGRDMITLAIADDGVGFEAAQAQRRASWGMLTMRERADAAGARLSVESAPGRGTRVRVELARG